MKTESYHYIDLRIKNTTFEAVKNRLKYLLTLFILFTLTETALGQLGVGIQGGGNFASVQFRNRQDFLIRDIKLLESYQFGGVVRYVPEKHAGFQLEFNVSRKGWRDVHDTSNVETRRTISYYEMPFLTQFIVGSKKVRIILEGGAYVAYAYSSTIETRDLDVANDSGKKSDYNFRDGIDNRWDYGLMARAGFQLRLPFGAIEAKAFYSYGYGNLYLDKSRALELSQNRVYGATLGYIYFFGKEKESASDPE